MDTHTRSNYSLANTNKFSLIKDIILFFMEITGENLGSLYDIFTLDAPQAVKRQIDSSVSTGGLGQILKVIENILEEAKYLFNTPTTGNSSSQQQQQQQQSQQQQQPNNSYNTSLPKSYSSPNFYSTNSDSQENISFTSHSSFIPSNSSPTKQQQQNDSANSTPGGGNTPAMNLSAEQMKIKQLELELLKFKEAAAAMMKLKNDAAAQNNNNNISTPPPVSSLPPPPPPPPPPVFKATAINLKRGVSSPNLSAGGASNNNNPAPPQFNIAEILLKKPLLKKVNLDRSPGGTPSKDKPKGGVEDVFKAILHKFKNENQSPCKGQTDDESSDSDFE